MTARIRHQDLEIIRRYTDQPDRLPDELRRRIEQRWGGDPVQLYALADLDASMRLSRTWLALGPRCVAIVRQPEGAGHSEITSLERSSIRALQLAPGLSCSVLTILGEPDMPALATLRFTHRQKRAIENIRFLLDEGIAGREVPPGDGGGDEDYIEGLARPIREAQALVARREIAVLWRLLGYLAPYRGRVVLGMSAAALITVFALVPPYLAGRLIDDAIEPVQAGTLAAGDGSRIAWIAVAAMAVVYVMRQLCAWVRLRVMSVLGEYVARDLRNYLYAHLQSLSLSFFSRKKTGSLITRVSSDTDRLWEFLALGVVDVSLSLVMYGERLNTLFLRAWRKWSSVTDVLSDTIPGMRVVKAFNHAGALDAKSRDLLWAFV
ncbi:MAG: ABC transporter transmembrane domain-containing protein, partial [Proteobacteria bacterium]|nr:ABC transporter transmembrane domain-containing protein [Pseudomonadota bacterium]